MRGWAVACPEGVLGISSVLLLFNGAVNKSCMHNSCVGRKRFRENKRKFFGKFDQRFIKFMLLPD